MESLFLQENINKIHISAKIYKEELGKIKNNNKTIAEEARGILLSLKSYRPFIRQLEVDIKQKLNDYENMYSENVQEYFSNAYRNFISEQENKIEFQYEIGDTEEDVLNNLISIQEKVSSKKYEIKSVINFLTDLQNKFIDNFEISNAIDQLIFEIAQKLENSRFYLFSLESQIDYLCQQPFEEEDYLDNENSIISVFKSDDDVYILHKTEGLISPIAVNFIPYPDDKVAFYSKHVLFFSVENNSMRHFRKTKPDHLTEVPLDSIIPLEEILCMSKGDNGNLIIVQKNQETNVRITFIKDTILSDTINKTSTVKTFSDEVIGAFFATDKLHVYLKNGCVNTITIKNGIITGTNPQKLPYFYFPQCPFCYDKGDIITFFSDIEGRVSTKVFKHLSEYPTFIHKMYNEGSIEYSITEISNKLLIAANKRIYCILKELTVEDELAKSITENYMQNIVVLLRIIEKAEKLSPPLRCFVTTTMLRLLALNMNACSLRVEKSELPHFLIERVQNTLAKSFKDIGGLPIVDSLEIFVLIVYRDIYSDSKFLKEVFWNLPCHTFEINDKYGPQIALMVGVALKEIEEGDTRQKTDQLIKNFPHFVRLHNMYGLEDPLCDFIRVYFSTIDQLSKDPSRKTQFLELLKCFAINATSMRKSAKVSFAIISNIKQIIDQMNKIIIVKSSKYKNHSAEMFEVDHRTYKQMMSNILIESIDMLEVDSNGIVPLVVDGKCIYIDNEELMSGEIVVNKSHFYIEEDHCYEESMAVISGEEFNLNISKVKSNIFLLAYIAHLLGHFCTDSLVSTLVSDIEKAFNFISMKRDGEQETREGEILDFYNDLISEDPSPRVAAMYNFLNRTWRFRKPNKEIIDIEKRIFRALISSLGKTSQLFLFADNVYKKEKTDVVSTDIVKIWRTLFTFRRDLMKLVQINDSDSHQLNQNFVEKKKNLLEKVQFIEGLNLSGNFENILNNVVEFLKSPICIAEVKNLQTIEEERVKMRIETIKFIDNFFTINSPEISTIFLENIDFPIDLINSNENVKGRFNEFIEKLDTKELVNALMYTFLFTYDRKVLDFCKLFGKNKITKKLEYLIIKKAMEVDKEEAIARLSDLIQSNPSLTDFATTDIIKRELAEKDWKTSFPIIKNITDEIVRGNISVCPEIIKDFIYSIGKKFCGFEKDNYMIPEFINFVRATISEKSPVRKEATKIVHNLFLTSKTSVLIGIFNVIGQSIVASISTSTSLSEDGKRELSFDEVSEKDQFDLMPFMRVDPPEFDLTKRECKIISDKLEKLLNHKGELTLKECVLQASILSYLPILFQNKVNTEKIVGQLPIDALIELASKKCNSKIPKLLNYFESSAKDACSDVKAHGSNAPCMFALRSGEVIDNKIISDPNDICVFIGSKKIDKNGEFAMNIKINNTKNKSILVGIMDKSPPIKFTGFDYRGVASTYFGATYNNLFTGDMGTFIYSDKTFRILSYWKPDSDDFYKEYKAVFWNIAGDFYPVVITFYDQAEIIYDFQPTIKSSSIKSYFGKKKHCIHKPPVDPSFEYNNPKYIFPQLFVGQIVKLTDINYYGVIMDFKKSQVTTAVIAPNSPPFEHTTLVDYCKPIDESFGKILHRAKAILKVGEGSEKRQMKIASKICSQFCIYALVSLFNFKPELVNNRILFNAICKIFEFDGGRDIEHYEKCIPGINPSYRETLAKIIIDNREGFLDYLIKCEKYPKTKLLLLSTLKPFLADLPHEHLIDFSPPKGTKYTYTIKNGSLIEGHICIPRYIEEEHSSLPCIHCFMILLQIMNTSDFANVIIANFSNFFMKNDAQCYYLLSTFLEELCKYDLRKDAITTLFSAVNGFAANEENSNSIVFSHSLAKIRDIIFTKFLFVDQDFAYSILPEKIDESINYLNHKSFITLKYVKFNPSVVAVFVNTPYKITFEEKEVTYFFFKSIVTEVSGLVFVDENEDNLEAGTVIEGKHTLKFIGKSVISLRVVDDIKKEVVKEIVEITQSNPNVWESSNDECLSRGEIPDCNETIIAIRSIMCCDCKEFSNDSYPLPSIFLSQEENECMFRELILNYGTANHTLSLKFDRIHNQTDQDKSYLMQFVRQCSDDSKISLMRNTRIWRQIFVGEKGIDAGGLSNETYTNICAELMDAKNGVFITSPDRRNDVQNSINVLLPNPNCDPVVLKCVGGLFGGAMCSRMKRNMRLPLFLWKYIYGFGLDENDIFEYDSFFKAKYDNIKNATKDDMDKLICQSWSVTLLNGETKVLKDKKVSFEEKDEFLSTIVQIRLEELQKALDPILYGFSLVVPKEVYSHFTPSQLNSFICVNQKLKPQDVIKNLKSSCSMDTLIEVISDYDEEHLRSFLMFVTGEDVIDGKISVEYCEEKMLPVAHTCFKKLVLSFGLSKEELMKDLELAFTETTFQLA